MVFTNYNTEGHFHLHLITVKVHRHENDSNNFLSVASVVKNSISSKFTARQKSRFCRKSFEPETQHFVRV